MPILRNLRQTERIDDRKRYRNVVRPPYNHQISPYDEYTLHENNKPYSPSTLGKILFGFYPSSTLYHRPRRPKLTKEQRDEQFKKEYLSYITQDFPNFQLGTFDLGFGLF